MPTPPVAIRAPRGVIELGTNGAGEKMLTRAERKKAEAERYRREYDELLRIWGESLPALAKRAVDLFHETGNPLILKLILDRTVGPVGQRIEIDQTTTEHRVVEFRIARRELPPELAVLSSPATPLLLQPEEGVTAPPVEGM